MINLLILFDLVKYGSHNIVNSKFVRFFKKTIVNLSIFKISHSNKIKIKIKIHTL
jgi:hypothetical protein